jgi:hypothetical protein
MLSSLPELMGRQHRAVQARLTHWLSRPRLDARQKSRPLSALANRFNRDGVFSTAPIVPNLTGSKKFLNFPTLRWEVKPSETANWQMLSGVCQRCFGINLKNKQT